MRRRTVLVGAAGLGAGLLVPGLTAHACGIWKLPDTPLGLTLHQAGGVVIAHSHHVVDGTHYRFGRRIYRLTSGKNPRAWFEKTGARLFDVDVDTGRLLYRAEPAGAQTSEGVEVGDVEYRFSITKHKTPHYFHVRIERDDEVISDTPGALDFVCGAGSGIRRRLVFHAMWRELVWPDFKVAMQNAGHYPPDDVSLG